MFQFFRSLPVTILFFYCVPTIQYAQGPQQHDVYGSWTMVEMVYGGQVQDPPDAGFKSIKIEKGKWISTHIESKLPVEWKIVIRSDKTPKEIDLIGIVNEKKESVPFQGIYEFKDGRLRIILAQAGMARPTEFAPLKNETWTMYTLKKAK